MVEPNNGSNINLTKRQIELLREMVYTGHSPRFSLRGKSSRERKNILRRIRTLEDNMEEEGVHLKELPEQEEYWFDFSDIYKAEFNDLIKEKREKDTVMLYLTPGRFGIGTKLFPPLVAEGLNIYLKHNYPSLRGQQMEGHLIESIDAVVLLGGLLPEMPYNARSKTADKKIALLAKLTPEEMSEERIGEEESRLEQIANSTHLSDKIKERYENEAYGTIMSIEEGAVKARSALESMLSGYSGPIFYQVGNEDLANAFTLKKDMEKEVSGFMSELSKQRRKIKTLLEDIQSKQVRRIISQNVYDVLQGMDDYIFSDKSLKWVAENYERTLKDFLKDKDDWVETDDDFLFKGELVNWYDNNFFNMNRGSVEEWLKRYPRKSSPRHAFETLKDEYIQKVEENLVAQNFEWSEEYFENMSKEEITKFKERYEAKVCSVAEAEMEIIRTYYGLGWKTKGHIRKTILAKEKILENQIVIGEKEREIEYEMKMLHRLGWIGEKKLTEANISDAQLLKIRAQERMSEIYQEAAGDLDLRVLGEGISHINVNGITFSIEHTKETPQGNKKLKEVMKRASEEGMHDEFISDVYLLGPAGKTIIMNERKRPHVYAEAPKLEYLTDNDDVLFIQLANMYSSDAIRHYKETTAGEQRDNKAPVELSSGQILVHILAKEGGESHFDVINVEDLRDIALNERSLKRRKGKKKQEQKKQRIYMPTIKIISSDDNHFGDSDPYLQDPAAIFRQATIKYLRDNFGYADVLKISEPTDGAQNIYGIELACQHNVFAEYQLRETLKNIRDAKLGISQEKIFLEELVTMMAEAMPRPTVDEQMDELLSSDYGDYIRETLEANKHVVAIGGDHSGRTTKHKGDEATRLRNGFKQVYMTLPNGEIIRASDNIFIGNQGETSSHVFYRGVGKLEGINLYCCHKAQPDVLKQIRGSGSNVKVVLPGHRHHLDIVVAGGQCTVMPPGMVPPYNYVFEKGLRPSLQGTVITTLPEQKKTLYRRSVSFDIASNLALERAYPEFGRRKAVRKELLQYIAPK